MRCAQTNFEEPSDSGPSGHVSKGDVCRAAGKITLPAPTEVETIHEINKFG
jgi:hypothetical protein